MPFTPIHIGPGLAIKSLMQKKFSLMVFGWSQIVIDIQPLIVILSGKGNIHGFTHTYLGATLIALFCAFSGKYLGEIGLKIIRKKEYLPISWKVAFISAFIGTYSHVLLDSVMHYDVIPFSPFWKSNILLSIVSVNTLNIFCLASGLIGIVIYYLIENNK
jgi:membrane-bound metal-dependent hydrolase YbcI (DUF457 family)|tara:strand:+ start:681 stop:1160 length:480 start_codon:yes stop_codon:yes gene_type:complete